VIGPPYRLLALDVDGTLLRTDKSLSPRTRQSLDAARAAGVRLLLVTGRRYPAARRVALALGGEVDLVLHNGALIMERGAVLRCLPLRRETAILAIRAGRERRADPVLHLGQQGQGQLLVEGIEPSNTLLVYYLDKSHPDVVVVPELEAALSEDPIQVMFGGSLADMDALEPHLTARLGPAAAPRIPLSRSESWMCWRRAPARTGPWPSCNRAGASRPRRRWRSETTGTIGPCWSRRAWAW
jgi:hypothetical protein